MNESQNTDTLLMIRPYRFYFNEQTAKNNYYQKQLKGASPEAIKNEALREFDDFVDKLRAHNINVVVIEDTPEPATPDSIFPNNWVSFHSDGSIGLYPMYAENRRLERRNDIIEHLKREYAVNTIHDFTAFEEENRFLEGTGSIVLDRANKIAYAAISERTDETVLDKFCDTFSYEKVAFHAYQTVGEARLPIYHTNVLMCVAQNFVVICLQAIDDLQERQKVEAAITASGKAIIEISEAQKSNFAGNMLEVKSAKNELYLIMSSAAYHTLSPSQINQIEQFDTIIHSPLTTIETLGGGSARCMMAEIFLPKR